MAKINIPSLLLGLKGAAPTGDIASYLVGKAIAPAPVPPTPADKPYLTFSAPSSFSLSKTSKTWDGTVEYSTDAATWTTWDGTEISAVANNDTYYIYLRGTNNTVLTNNVQFQLGGSNTISVSGNIETLLDYATVERGGHPVMGSGCFNKMFYNQATIVSAHGLKLASPILSTECYKYMFYGCTALQSAPQILASTLATSCCFAMFKDCKALESAPELPATAMENGCYSSMFSGCTSLTSAPTLPATTLAEKCYIEMFSGCTSLTRSPALPATTLAQKCYQSMFNNCSQLTVPPELPATTLAEYCYYQMFYGCTALTSAPSLPATTLANNCYRAMFYVCTSLTVLPLLPATTLAEYCYHTMFYACTALKMSATQAGEYQYAYRIPSQGVGTTASSAVYQMFAYTGGTWKDTPTINTTYYTDHEPV